MGMTVDSGSRRKKAGPLPDINVTPLVDVVLVLLIIFMVVTPQMDSGENVEMPSIFFPDEEAKGMDPIELTLTASGRFLIEKRAYPKEGLEDTLMQMHAVEPNRRLVLKGDRELNYKEVRDVFAIAEKVGFPGVALKVGKKEGDPRQQIDNTTAAVAPDQG